MILEARQVKKRGDEGVFGERAKEEGVYYFFNGKNKCFACGMSPKFFKCLED